jgi:alkanesulfonate monooxygenase SsuD/methylene tetrahydromethanopterin reductase-like flavin-dependent oxidoreductase (luciferase family)
MTTASRLPRMGVTFRPQLPPERLRDFVVSAEAAGLTDVWLWEDCFLEGGLTTAAAALAWTSSVRVGLGLMPVPLRNPALAAMEVATLARLFPGRFVPAAGHGVLDWMDQAGAQAASPMALLREWVTAVRALLHGQTVTVSGRYVRLREVALDWPPDAAAPLLVGARGPKTLALAGEVADGVVLDGGTTPDGVRRALATVTGQRPYEVVVYLLCGAGERGKRLVEAELAGRALSLPDGAAAGSPADVARAIHALAHAGASTVVLYPAAADQDSEALIALASAAQSMLRGDGGTPSAAY